MKNFDKYLEQLKGGLNEFITPEQNKETVDKIASFSSIIDNMQAEYNSVQDEYNELKNDYIKVVKNQSFKVDHDPMDDVLSGTKTEDKLIDEIFGL